MIKMNLQLFGGRGSGGGNNPAGKAAKVTAKTAAEKAAPAPSVTEKAEKQTSSEFTFSKAAVGRSYENSTQFYKALREAGYTSVSISENTDTNILKMGIAERTNDKKKVIQESEWNRMDRIDRREYEINGYHPGKSGSIEIQKKGNRYVITKFQKY